MSTATVTLKISTGGFSDLSDTLSPLYTGINGGRYDLAEGVGDPSPFTLDVPFGSVAEATLLYVKNMSGQDLIVTFDGGEPLTEHLEHGKTIFKLAEGVPVAASLSLTTTAAVAGTDRFVEYRIAGDPA